MHLAVVALVLIFGSFQPVNSVLPRRHLLEYVYTALSKPINQQGIHEFTAMGLLNNRMIDYYDNDLQKKIPKQEWMKERLDKDYWDKGTQSRKFKEQWFKVNIGILMERMRQNDTDIHSLQWKHGCEVEEQQGSVTFIKGFDQYSYDGEDFLSFDDSSTQWVAPNAAAVPTKRKWDGEQILNQYTKGYLEKECVDWLKKFMDYGEKSLRKAKPPVVEVYGKASNTVGNVKLTCWATGFLPKDITLNIRKNEAIISDGVVTSGVRPNNDDTHQIWKRVEIPMNDQGNYDCFVEHQAMDQPIIKAFPENKCGDCPLVKVGTVGGLVGFIICLALVGGILFLLYKRGLIALGRHTPKQQVLNKQATFFLPGGVARLPTSNLGNSIDKTQPLGSIQTDGILAGDSIDKTQPLGSIQTDGIPAGGRDNNSDSGNSSGGTPNLGSTLTVCTFAETEGDSAAPLLKEDSTQHMNGEGMQPNENGCGAQQPLLGNS